MSSLKNTPWIATETSCDSDFWIVTDSKCYFISDYIDEPTARAIADLPKTLERLERLEKAALAYVKFQEAAIGLDDIKTHKTLINNLKKALEE